MISNERKCAICGEDDPRVLIEAHHIFAHGNGETIFLCKNDHDRITYDQNRLSPRERRKNAKREDLLAYELISIGSLLETIGKEMKKRGLDKHGQA